MVTSLLEPTFEVVGGVADGEALLEAAAKLNPDVIVTDISMPVLNGIEAVSKLKKSSCKSKIIFLTVHADPDYIRACLATNADAYVIKAMMATDLIPAIQEALMGRRFISPSANYQDLKTDSPANFA
jgi:DNA-binding NarL/FixJ family response regulator